MSTTEIDRPKHRSLLHISDEMTRLRDALEEIELSPEDQDAAIRAYLAAGTGDEIAVKLDNYAALVKDTEGYMKVRQEEVDRLESLIETGKNLTKRLKLCLLWFFGEQGMDKVETARHKIRKQNNGGVCPLIIDEGAEIPDGFTKTVIETDTEKIRAFLEQGGTLTWARIGDRGQHIRIQ